MRLSLSLINSRNVSRQRCFLSVIGDGAMEVFKGMHFANSEDKHKLNKVIEQFEITFIGETNETYERFVFMNEGETIEQYITALRTLAQSCNFCTCLEKTLLRDRVVLGIRHNSVRKKLLQERNLTLTKAVDICRSSETTSKQLRNMTSLNEKPADHEIKAIRGQSQKNRRVGPSRPRERRRCKYCGEIHEFDKNSCPAYGNFVTIAAFVIISQRFAKKSGRTLHGRSNRLAKRYLATLVILCIRIARIYRRRRSPSRANETQTIQEQDFGCNEY